MFLKDTAKFEQCASQAPICIFCIKTISELIHEKLSKAATFGERKGQRKTSFYSTLFSYFWTILMCMYDLFKTKYNKNHTWN